MRRGQQAHARLPVHTYQPWPTSLGCSARVCTHRGRSTCHQCSSPPARAPHSCWGECAQWRAGCGAKHSAAAGVKGARAFCPDIRRAPPRCSCADEHRQAGRHWRADRCNSGAQQPAQRRGTRTFAHAFIVHLAEDLRVAARADAAQGNALVPLGCGVAVLGGARALPRGADLEHDIRVLAACNAAARQESGAMQGGRRGRDKTEEAVASAAVERQHSLRCAPPAPAKRMVSSVFASRPAQKGAQARSALVHRSSSPSAILTAATTLV